jgi:hypothetical protein
MTNYELILTQVIFKEFLQKGIKSVETLFDTHTKSINLKAKAQLKEEEYTKFKENYDLEISENEIINNIKNNIESANIWSKEINFSTAIRSKKLTNIFVDIDLYLNQLNTRFDVEEVITKINSKKLLQNFDKHKIIYGGAGAGKTTLIKKIYIDYISDYQNYDFSFPIVLRFREIDYETHFTNKPFGLFQILINILGIKIKFPKEFIDSFSFEYSILVKNTIISFLNHTNILLILDGFDEIPDSKLKMKIQRDFNDLSLNLKKSKFILTSRNNDFVLKLANTNTYEICPLNDKQIKLLINKWIINKKKSLDLFDKIKASPYYDTTMRPLTLSHLCAIYERKKTIPPKPRYIYDFVLNLLLESWDQQRSILRPSKYAEFYIEKKKEFLAHLSYWFSYHLNKTVFNSDEIRKCYNKIYKSHNLPSSQAKKVVIELENHTGIFVQSGYDSFQFSHKSLQEFLTAKYLSALPKVPDHKILNNMPNETAILVCLSSSPNYFFEIFNKDFEEYSEYFWSVFLNRLIEEKPDFDEKPAVLVFFFNNIWNHRHFIFNDTFIQLFNTTNLKICIKPFLKIYKQNGVFDKYTSYISKDTKIPIDKRNYFPTQLHIQKQLYELIKKYL